MSKQTEQPGCLFCWMAEDDASSDRERLVLYRGTLNLVAVNRYPYNNGHLMIAPFEHVADLASASVQQLEEMMRLAQRAERLLRDEYHAHGFNVGMNVGAAAGAGVAHHHHLHIVPRWQGDTNFMGTTSETRVVPEMPEATYDRLVERFTALEEEEED